MFHDEGHGFDEFGLSPTALASAQRFAAPFYDRYFRVTSTGAERIPADGPAILVANHGGVLPVDAAMLCLDVLRKTERIPRAVSDHFVPRLPLISTWFARFGVVSGTRANVRRLLERGELIAIWPEGVSGPSKSYRERYKIQDWRVGFAELAIRHRAPVIPVGIVGSEESWPLIATLRGLRAFGAPYLPIPATPVPLPAHYYLRYGAPIELHYGLDPAAADDPEIVRDAAMQVKAAVEDLLTIALAMRPGVFR